MLEIRFHARAGQGAAAAAQVLAEAALLEGKYIQAFPQFGPEQRGAPVQTFVRISDQPILIHSQIEYPDVVVILEKTLLGKVDLCAGVKSQTLVLINSSKKDVWQNKPGQPKILDASKIALETLGRNIPNTAMLGALVKALGVVKPESLEKVIRQKFSKRWGQDLVEKNIQALQQGFNQL